MHRFLTRLPVLWLLVLIVLPCAAPFSTSDLFDWAPRGHRQGTTLHREAVLDHALPDPSPLWVEAEQTRQPRLSSAAASFVASRSGGLRRRPELKLSYSIAPSTMRPILRI
jgi:hypothetical protein